MMPTPLDEFWLLCLARLEQELSVLQFNTMIRPLQLQEDEEGLVVFAPSRFALQFLTDRYLSRIEALAQEHFGRDMPVRAILGSMEKPQAPVEKPSTAPEPEQETLLPSSEAAPKAARSNFAGAGNSDASRLNANYSFDTLVTGKANQLARAAAQQIAENPGGSSYNPFFVYGGSGLGKTHLIQAVGNYVQAHNPKAKIRYIHAERYVQDVVKAYRYQSFDELKRYYHSLDLLLIDDIQFIAGKARTQEEFFYAFNALIESHKQIIMTCDTFYKNITEMDDRLVTRIGWGLTVAIEPPELEMRVAILNKKAAQENFHLDDAVSFFIAKHVRSNVRDLEGALKRVLAYAKFTRQSISLELTKEALKDTLAAENRQISVENIQKTVAEFYRIKVSDMHSQRRTRNVARPRQMAIALARELTPLSLPDIGESFGGRDHTTVLHACRQIAKLKESDTELRHDYNVLMQMLKN